jgi:hypothetical protein
VLRRNWIGVAGEVFSGENSVFLSDGRPNQGSLTAFTLRGVSIS